MALSRFEFCLSFQINISCCEESFVNVCVHRADRHIQFRVICKDLIRGLPLLNQWRYDLVFLMELVLGHIYSRTRRYQQFTIFSVSSTAVVIRLSEDSPLVEMESGGCVILGEYICIRKVK